MPALSFKKSLYELLSSMRFAISLLTVLAIASVIGTVLKQNEPYPNYAIEFGQFWFSMFHTLGLFDVYHSAWFLVILCFLVVSTSLCVLRNTPLMLREMRSFREHAQENSLRHFAHQAEFESPLPGPDLVERLTGYLSGHGFRSRVAQAGENGGDVLVAAKAGSYHRLGYVLTHTAIVVICIGGLIDGNVPLKIEQVLGYKKIETRDIPENQVPPVSRLSPANLSFRGNVTIPEGSSADVVFLNVGPGYLVQDLPFTIMLKRFHIEHYPSGQPKSFASDVVVTDRATGRSFDHTITVNHPLVYKGVAIYQASFEDGGSKLTLDAWNLFAPTAKFDEIHARVNQSLQFSSGRNPSTMEFTDFRALNIENAGNEGNGEPQKSRGLLSDAMGVFGTNAADVGNENLRDLGPSFQYKIRDAQGQATEYNNYMLPIEVAHRWYLMSGMRGSPAEPFRYVRFPLDANSRIDGFMRLRGLLLDKTAYPEIARRFADTALMGGAVSQTLRQKFMDSTVKVLQMFGSLGYEGVARFITQSVPQAEQKKVADTYLRILEGAAFQAYQLSREQAGEPPLKEDGNGEQFVRDSLNAVNDLFFYGAPVYLQLTRYDQIRASGLQLTRSPGKYVVYGGSALLVLGVFAMFYIRERRIWCLVKPQTGRVLFAMSANRKTLDFEREFDIHKQRIAELMKG